jgi:hypothetical protein
VTKVIFYGGLITITLAVRGKTPAAIVLEACFVILAMQVLGF